MRLSYDDFSNYTIIDLETTGLSPTYDSIIEVGGLKIRNNEIVDTFHTFVNPSIEIPFFITELTGITNEDVANAPNQEDSISALLQFIGADVIIGHNVRFDINFLNSTHESLNTKTEIYSDTMYLSRKALSDLGRHRLIDLVNYYNIETGRLHNALEDCKTTKIIYDKLHQFMNDNEVSYTSCFPKYNETDRKKIYHSNCLNIDLDKLIECPDNLFYKKNVCFSGVLEKIRRADAIKYITNIGGYSHNNVISTTNILVLGSLEYCLNINDGKSSKHKKAIAWMLKSKDIIIISETEFYTILEETV